MGKAARASARKGQNQHSESGASGPLAGLHMHTTVPWPTPLTTFTTTIPQNDHVHCDSAHIIDKHKSKGDKERKLLFNEYYKLDLKIKYCSSELELSI
jgi:hypothetical protein